MNAWSPSASVIWRWAPESSAYAQVSRSFKTPTLTQLYELRRFTVAPGFDVMISNPALDPQFATQIEAGVRHRFGPWMRGDLAIYTTKAKDEIGFDLPTLSFANLGESTHRGVELSLQAFPVDGLEITGGYSYTRARFDTQFGGQDEDVVGKQINNVPRHVSRLGATYRHGVLTVGGTVMDVRDQWADESNTVRIDDYTVVDLRCGVHLSGHELYAKILNALDETYTPAGFVTVTETGQEVALFYPASGRRMEVGVRFLVLP